MLKILKKQTHLYKNITFQTDARGYRKPKYLLSVKAWVGKLSRMSLICKLRIVFTLLNVVKKQNKQPNPNKNV